MREIMTDPFDVIRPLLPLTVSADDYDLVANYGGALLPVNYHIRKKVLPALAHAANCHDTLVMALDAAKKKIEALEQLRPVWAQGYTSESAAAQAYSGALTTLWNLLGVSNQTQAVLRLESLTRAANLHVEPYDG